MIRKIFTIGGFLILSSTTSFALDYQEIQEGCKGMASVAETVMIARQKGISAEQVRNYFYGELIDGGHSRVPDTVNVVETIINISFLAPIGKTLGKRQEFVDTMRNDVYESCMKNS